MTNDSGDVQMKVLVLSEVLGPASLRANALPRNGCEAETESEGVSGTQGDEAVRRVEADHPNAIAGKLASSRRRADFRRMTVSRKLSVVSREGHPLGANLCAAPASRNDWS